MDAADAHVEVWHRGGVKCGVAQRRATRRPSRRVSSPVCRFRQFSSLAQKGHKYRRIYPHPSMLALENCRGTLLPTCSALKCEAGTWWRAEQHTQPACFNACWF
eukprot:350916-Chlamydomonas_euryale.AAC.2